MARFAPKNTLPALGGLLGAALLIGYAPVAAEGAMRGLSACGRVILPAVFPFLAVSVFLAGAPGGAGLAALLSGVMRYCFRLPAAAAPALLMSWIGGYPAGAKTLAELRRQGALTARETEEAAPVLIYSGPAYMAGVVGGRIFGSTVVGIFLFLCQLAAGLLLGRLFAWGRPLPPKGSRLRSSPKTEPAAVLLVRSVGSAASSAVNICAFVVLLSAFAEVFSACGLFPLLERGLPGRRHTAFLPAFWRSVRVRRWRRSCPLPRPARSCRFCFPLGDFRFAVRFRPALGRSRCPGVSCCGGGCCMGFSRRFWRYRG